MMGQRFVQIYGQGESPMTITALGRDHFADSAHPRHLRAAGVGRRRAVRDRGPHRRRERPSRVRRNAGRGAGSRRRGDEGLLAQPGGDGGDAARRVAAHGRRRRARRRRLSHPDGPLEGPDHQRRLEHLPAGGRGGAAAAPGCPRGLGRRPAAPGMGRGGGGVRRVGAPARASTRTRSIASASTRSRGSSGRASTGSSTSLPKNNYGKVLKTELRAQLARERERRGLAEPADGLDPGDRREDRSAEMRRDMERRPAIAAARRAARSPRPRRRRRS